MTREPADASPDALAQTLLRIIRSGDCVVDDRLVPERALAQRLGITRSRLRGVLAKLEGEGLIFRRQGQGTFVRPPPLVETNQFRCLSRRVTANEIMEARLLLEPAFAQQAARRAGPGDVALLQKLAQATANATHAAEYEQADDVFHYKLAEIAGNPVLLTLFEGIREVRRQEAWSQHRIRHWSREKAQVLARQHLSICDLINARSGPRAASQMRSHLRSSANMFHLEL